MDEETADWQFSLIYGHVGIAFVSFAYPMEESRELFEKAIGLRS